MAPLRFISRGAGRDNVRHSVVRASRDENLVQAT